MTMRPTDHVVKPRTRTVVALGAFDGVHRGHLALIDDAASRARTERKDLVALVIDRPGRTPRLTSVRRRCQLLVRAGVSSASVVSVGRGEPFADRVAHAVRSLRPAVVVIDVESMSAAQRRAVAAELVGLNAPVDLIPSRVDPVHGSITTPAIVDHVRNGDVAVAHDMLGRPFELEGAIKRQADDAAGASRWFYATSDATIISPAPGIYVARVRVRGQWRGAALLIGTGGDVQDELVISERASSSATVLARTTLVEIGVLERWPESAGSESDGVTAVVAEWRRRHGAIDG